jgi:hypothetical protein
MTILRPDDLAPGILITVLNGDTCEAGCCETYKQFKGVPMCVLAIQLPYIVCGLPGQIVAHLDVRECDLMRVELAYAGCFGMGVKQA